MPRRLEHLFLCELLASYSTKKVNYWLHLQLTLTNKFALFHGKTTNSETQLENNIGDRRESFKLSTNKPL